MKDEPPNWLTPQEALGITCLLILLWAAYNAWVLTLWQYGIYPNAN